jgi:hypothetical protein
MEQDRYVMLGLGVARPSALTERGHRTVHGSGINRVDVGGDTHWSEPDPKEFGFEAGYRILKAREGGTNLSRSVSLPAAKLEMHLKFTRMTLDLCIGGPCAKAEHTERVAMIWADSATG